MDWTKAKTILIVALLATNLFLIFTYGFKDKDMYQTTNETALIQILEDRGILLEADIPKRHLNMPILHGEYLSYSEEDAYALMQNQSVLPSDASGQDYIDLALDFIEYLGLMSENVVFDEIWSEETVEENYLPDFKDTKVYFRNEINHIIVEGSQMICSFAQGKMIGFECKWLDPIEFSQRKLETISAAVALMSLENPDKENDMVISSIEMVYAIPKSDVDVEETLSDTAFPTWKITTSDGKEFFVEASQR